MPVDSLRVVCRLRSASGSEPLELAFDTRWQSFERIDAAFLLLEAGDDAPAQVRVRAESRGSAGAHAGVTSPSSEGLMTPTGRVRIDVTELVRSWQGSSTTPRAITLSTTDGSPLRLSLGTASGVAPRLEVYGR